MRKSQMVPVGLVSAAVLAVAGIAVGNAASASPQEPPATGSAPATTAAAATPIGQADAEQAALAAVPGSSVLETRLQRRDGRLVWNVHLSTVDGVVEVRVDAQTGTVALDDDRAAATVPDNDGTDDHGGNRGPGRDAGHGDGRGSDDPAGHH